jgi:3-oxoacyl-[acyl-carrier protein] reductase
MCRLANHHSWPSGGGGILVNVTRRSAHRGDDADQLAFGAAKAACRR